MFLIFAASLITYFTRGSSTIATGLICVPIFAAETKYLFGTALDVIAMAIVVAAFVKSAQIFFHT
jgi:NADH:ubiquinone oxidoreductase subunit 5 (subunit L)/multisubunit Na+/H+ antiporter MnhA subunit